MALQLGLKRSLFASQTHKISAANAITDVAARRWKSADAGDVIGIDLGTTNSCVAVMVSNHLVIYCRSLAIIFISCQNFLPYGRNVDFSLAL